MMLVLAVLYAVGIIPAAALLKQMMIADYGSLYEPSEDNRFLTIFSAVLAMFWPATLLAFSFLLKPPRKP